MGKEYEAVSSVVIYLSVDANTTEDEATEMIEDTLDKCGIEYQVFETEIREV